MSFVVLIRKETSGCAPSGNGEIVGNTSIVYAREVNRTSC